MYFYLTLTFLVIFVVYLMIDENLIFTLKTGIDRLIFMASPIFILLIIKYINSLKIKLY